MKQYILITGCAFYNRGSQAMLFNTVDELKRRFPAKKIIMLSSMDYNKDNSQYAFEVFPDYLARLVPFPMQMIRKGAKIILQKHDKTADEEKITKELDNILCQTYMIVDAAGYALSSRWKPEWRNFVYLMKIAVAKKYNIPLYLMQQSFGPFKYTGIIGSIIFYNIKKYLQYPRLIFAREEEGYNCIASIRKNGLYRMDDIVLLNDKFSLSKIYKEKPLLKCLELNGEKPKVAVIPNSTCVEQSKNKHELMKIYKSIIESLLTDYEVYIVKHSNDDENICKIIKNMFSNNDSVHIIVEELNCIEFEYLVKQFSFCVASRFHSIVHAFKNGIPCVVIGWAVKYKELLSAFHQEKYLFDVRNELEIQKIMLAIDNIKKLYTQEQDEIVAHLKKIQSVNSFDYVQQDVIKFYKG